MKKINFFSISVIFFLSIFSASLSQAALIGNTTQATLTLSPDTGTYQAGQTFSVDVIVNTNSQPVNAVAAYINYNPALLAVDAIDYTGSVFTIQWESSINSPVGMIKIGRSIAGSTVNTANGKIATLRLRGLANTTPSSDNFTFDFAAGDANKSAVFLADATGGTYILSGVYNGRYTITGGATDTQTPTVTAFIIPSSATSLTISVTSFTATDNVGVSGYMITESATTPSASAADWSAIVPISYTFSSSGSKTLYAWAKDAAINVSTSRSASVTINVSPSPSPSPTTSGSNPTTSPSPTPSVNSLPVGSLDEANDSRVTGWAYDLDAGTSPIDVHIYIDGVIAGAATANLSRPDIVGAASGAVNDANHGFNYSLPTLLAGTHRINVYAINTPSGTNPELPGSPKTISVSSNITPSPSPSPSPAPISVSDGSLIRAQGDFKVYLIDGNQLRLIPSAQALQDLGYSWSDIQQVDSAFISQYAQGSQLNVGGGPTTNGTTSPCASLPYSNNSLLRTTSSPKVYLVDTCQRRWIPTTEVFNANGYQWKDIKETTSADIDLYQDGPTLALVIPAVHKNAQLIKLASSAKVYALVSGKRHWIPNQRSFDIYGYSWANVKTVSLLESNKYPDVKLFKGIGDSKIYYFNAKGQKKWIINPEVFNSYNNKWTDILEVLPSEMDSYPTVTLIRLQGAPKVYLLEGTTKRWIKTTDAFNSLGYKWEDVDVINNSTELNAYREGDVLE